MSKSEFQQHVSQCLTHICDLAFLETSPLASFASTQKGARRSRGKSLRKAIWASIQALRPPDGTASDDMAWRAYRILEGRYLAGLDHADLEQSLSLSKSHYYREHARAVKALASILWQEWGSEDGVDGVPASTDPGALAMAELASMARQEAPEAVDVAEVLRDLLGLLEPDARGKGVSIKSFFPEDTSRVHCSPGVLRQCLLVPLSRAINCLEEGLLRVRLCSVARRIRVEIVASGARRQVQPDVDCDLIEGFVQLAGGEVSFEEARDRASICIWLPVLADRGTVLLVDNNDELALLFTRYLQGEPWVLLHAKTVAEALRVAVQQPIAAILLDVLMPHEDGWHLLRDLKSSPRLAQIPVLICSVLNQPRLALSLGAIGYLQKPVARDDLLAALDRWGYSAKKGPAGSPLAR